MLQHNDSHRDNYRGRGHHNILYPRPAPRGCVLGRRLSGSVPLPHLFWPGLRSAGTPLLSMRSMLSSHLYSVEIIYVINKYLCVITRISAFLKFKHIDYVCEIGVPIHHPPIFEPSQGILETLQCTPGNLGDRLWEIMDLPETVPEVPMRVEPDDVIRLR